MSIIVILIIVLLLFSPYYGINNNWGPAPYGGIGLVVLILVLYLVLGGRIH